ncbi:MAG: DUF928 domain-containing protein [Cyanobacteria bacterium J06636_16]
MKLILLAASAISLLTSGQGLYLQPLLQSTAQFQAPNVASLPEPPPRGTPTQRRPAGTRGQCDDSAYAMTPILPTPSTPNADFVGATQQSHPAFWFYIPEETDSSTQGRFSLEDADGNLIYRADFDFSTTPGLVGINVPETAPALQLGQDYRWYFNLYCIDEDASRENFLFHTGLITYTDDPDLTRQLSAASPSERLALYSRHNLWYDAVTDGDVNTLNALLSLIGLENLLDTPTIDPIPSP